MGRGLWPASPQLLPGILVPRRGPGLRGCPRGPRGTGLDSAQLPPPAELFAASGPAGDPASLPGAPHRCPGRPSGPRREGAPRPARSPSRQGGPTHHSLRVLTQRAARPGHSGEPAPPLHNKHTCPSCGMCNPQTFRGRQGCRVPVGDPGNPQVSYVTWSKDSEHGEFTERKHDSHRLGSMCRLGNRGTKISIHTHTYTYAKVFGPSEFRLVSTPGVKSASVSFPRPHHLLTGKWKVGCVPGRG